MKTRTTSTAVKDHEDYTEEESDKYFSIYDKKYVTHIPITEEEKKFYREYREAMNVWFDENPITEEDLL